MSGIIINQSGFLLKLDFKSGLSDAEVKNRLEKFGTNELAEMKTNPFLEFMLCYWGPVPWLLELAMGLSVAEINAILIAVYGIFMTPRMIHFWDTVR